MFEGIGTTKEKLSRCLIGCVKLSWFDSAQEGDKGRLRGETQEVTLLLLVLNYKQGETDFWIGYNVFYKWDDFGKKFMLVLSMYFTPKLEKRCLDWVSFPALGQIVELIYI